MHTLRLTTYRLDISKCVVGQVVFINDPTGDVLVFKYTKDTDPELVGYDNKPLRLNYFTRLIYPSEATIARLLTTAGVTPVVLSSIFIKHINSDYYSNNLIKTE